MVGTSCSKNSSTGNQALSILETTNNGDFLSADVCVCPPALVVSPTLASVLLTLRPTLGQHACKSGGQGLFAEKIVGTSLPHLFEHLSIDILVEKRLKDNLTPVAVSGNTKWTGKEGVAIVTLHYHRLSSKDVFEALEQAHELINELCATYLDK